MVETDLRNPMISKKKEIVYYLLTNGPIWGKLHAITYRKAWKGRVFDQVRPREPRQVEAGCGWIEEHGPGAARARCSPRRVRPSSRRSVLALREASAVRLARNQGGTASFFVPEP